MTSCRAHRKLYAQDILIDLMELQIKFAGFAVITTDAIATDRHFPDESRYGFRNPLCVMTKTGRRLRRHAAAQARPHLVLARAGTYIAEALDAFQGDHFSYVGEANHGGTGSPEFHDILDNKFRIVDSICIPQYPNHHDRVYHFTRKR